MKQDLAIGTLVDTQHNSDEIVKISCLSFYLENIGQIPVVVLGRTLSPGDSFSIPYSGIIYRQDLRIKFTQNSGDKNLYVLQAIADSCNG